MAAGERVASAESDGPGIGNQLVGLAIDRLLQLAELADAYGTTWNPDAHRLLGMLLRVELTAIACQRVVRAELVDRLRGAR